MPQMEIRDRTQAGKRLCRQNAKKLREIKAVLSIGDVGINPCAGFGGFDGIKTCLQFLDAEPGWGWPDESLANDSDVMEIIRFAETTRNMDGVVLVHCFAGRSRSTAAGAIIQAVWMGPELEQEAFDAAARATKDDTPDPNRHMIALADDLLDRNGSMINALENFLAEMQGSGGMYG